MPSNWPGWAKLYVGSSTAPQTPVNQEKVARGKVTALYNWLDTWPNVAHWWLTGSGERNQALWSTYSQAYVAKIMKIYRTPSPRRPPPLDVMARPRHRHRVGVVDVTSRRIQREQHRDRLRRPLGDRKPRRLRRRRVLYSRADGATATYSFYAKSVAWIGPVGPTRGKARVSVDGVVVGVGRPAPLVVQAAGQPLHAVLASEPATHTLTIKVIGSGRPVAIDEFIITR